MPTVDPHLASFGISDRRVLTGKSTPVVPVRASRAIRVWSAILAGYGGRSKAGLAALPARVGRCPGGGDGMIVASSSDLHRSISRLVRRSRGRGRTLVATMVLAMAAVFGVVWVRQRAVQCGGRFVGCAGASSASRTDECGGARCARSS